MDPSKTTAELFKALNMAIKEHDLARATQLLEIITKQLGLPVDHASEMSETGLPPHHGPDRKQAV